MTWAFLITFSKGNFLDILLHLEIGVSSRFTLCTLLSRGTFGVAS